MKQSACFESEWQMHMMGPLSACHSFMTNGAASSDIDAPSPDAKTVGKQGARHRLRKVAFLLLVKSSDIDNA